MRNFNHFANIQFPWARPTSYASPLQLPDLFELLSLNLGKQTSEFEQKTCLCNIMVLIKYEPHMKCKRKNIIVTKSERTNPVNEKNLKINLANPLFIQSVNAY